jgi:hypothetical protein
VFEFAGQRRRRELGVVFTAAEKTKTMSKVKRLVTLGAGVLKREGS